jgi:hypothetical protein
MAVVNGDFSSGTRADTKKTAEFFSTVIEQMPDAVLFCATTIIKSVPQIRHASVSLVVVSWTKQSKAFSGMDSKEIPPLFMILFQKREENLSI